MERIAAIIIPIFGMVLLGFASGKSKLLDNRASEGLAGFVFKIALPVMLFRLLVQLDLPTLQWRGMLAYYASAILMYLGCALFLRRVLKLPEDEAGALAMGSAFSNNVMLGLPLVLKVYGEAAVLPLMLIISLHTATLFGVGILYMERARARERSEGHLARTLLAQLLRNPIVLGLGCGLLFRLSPWVLPGFLDEIAEMLARAAVPCALFSMGLSLCGFPLRGNLRQALWIAMSKLILHPCLMALLAHFVFRLDSLWFSVTVLAAATPSGVNSYLFAQSYGKREATLAATVLISTLLGIVTLTGYLWLGL